MKTKKQIRATFWAALQNYDEQARAAGIRSKSQNYQCSTVRCSFVDFVDFLCRSGQISEKLANRATL